MSERARVYGAAVERATAAGASPAEAHEAGLAAVEARAIDAAVTRTERAEMRRAMATWDAATGARPSAWRRLMAVVGLCLTHARARPLSAA